MEIVTLLLGLAIILVVVIIWAFFWAVKSGQYEDEYTPSIRMLFDDPPPSVPASEEKLPTDK